MEDHVYPVILEHTKIQQVYQHVKHVQPIKQVQQLRLHCNRVNAFKDTHQAHRFQMHVTHA
jgi:hypothetical protein